jgi:MYXO-CTERM domain-containing protein
MGLQEGVGLFDGAVSEGASDYLGATITGTSALGRGFFQGTEDPLRELDPPNFEYRWPDHIGEVHDEGRILGGTLWDLRKALVAKYGESLGVQKTDAIWFGGIRRSVDMPSWYLEALITNDDDGDLQNGTPDVCEINAAFAAHGLYQPLGGMLELEQVELPDGSHELTLSYPSASAQLCPLDVEPTAVLRHRLRAPAGQSPGDATEVVFAETEPGLLHAVIPPQPIHTVTQFQVELDWGNGTTAMQPDNRADEWYEFFTGPTVEIWCSDFEGEDGWVLDGQWSIGAPQGGGGDPGEPYDGTNVAGVAGEFPGIYAPWSGSRMSSPTIDTTGHEVVRLQYRRWLTVEDGVFDQAWITANGEPVWRNFTSGSPGFGSVHHRDHEWRFHDIDLTSVIGEDGQLNLEFDLASDGGLEFGGWNVDSLCVVGHEPAVPPVMGAGGCGDGSVQSYEQCDDGNLDNGDGCSSGCLFETEGAPAEAPIDDEWDPDGRGCACATDDDVPPVGLVALPVLLLGLRRRRRSTPRL